MSTSPAKPIRVNAAETQPLILPNETGYVRKAVVWSSFLFALLQSICTFFAALNGLRLIIGVGSLVLSSSVGAVAKALHADWIRVPMVVLALAGSLLNLVVLWQVRRLRNRPASQWRQRPVGAGKIRMERMQAVLSFATLALLAVEEYLHLLWHHHL